MERLRPHLLSRQVPPLVHLPLVQKGPSSLFCKDDRARLSEARRLAPQRHLGAQDCTTRNRKYTTRPTAITTAAAATTTSRPAMQRTLSAASHDDTEQSGFEALSFMIGRRSLSSSPPAREPESPSRLRRSASGLQRRLAAAAARRKESLDSVASRCAAQVQRAKCVSPSRGAPFLVNTPRSPGRACCAGPFRRARSASAR